MEKSLFDRLGGEKAIDAAVEIFYQKVLSDSLLNPFFAHIEMKKQRAMQKAFLTVAFGGPNTYNGRNMRSAHANAVKNGLAEAHFNQVVTHLANTLKELGVSDLDIGEVAKIAESVKTDVLNQ